MTDEAKKSIKLPLLKIVFTCYGLFMDNFKSYAVLGSIFALIFMLINLISGQSLMCLSDSINKHIYCNNNLYYTLITNIVLWFVFCVYVRNWIQDAILKKRKFSFKNIVPNKTDLKAYGAVLVFFVSIAIAVTSGYFLYIRVPNPDWRIEILYFSFVSIGFLAPIMAIQFMPYLSFIIEEKNLPSLKDMWKTISGNRVFVFISVFCSFIFNFLILSAFLRYLISMALSGGFFVVVITDFLYNMVLMLFAAIFMNYCYLQKNILFERN